MPLASIAAFDFTTSECAVAIRSFDGMEGYAATNMRGDTNWNGNSKYPSFDLSPVPGMLIDLIVELEAQGWKFSETGKLSVSCRQHDMVLLDAKGNVMIPAVSWECEEASEIAARINASNKAAYPGKASARSEQAGGAES
jgi:sugar (pentulose or hexulose) kinase